MSCNGCRVLRKGCSENCLLRPCLEWIDGAEAQAHATVFVAKFFGRAGLMSFISAVPLHQRPALFQSLLYEACGRSVNPVNGAVALLATGNWHLCQTAVQTVLSGGTLQPIPELLSGGTLTPAGLCDSSEAEDTLKLHQDQSTWSRSRHQLANLELSLTPCSRFKESSIDNLRPGTPPLNSDASVTTTCTESLSGLSSLQGASGCEVKLLNLFS